MRTHSIITFLLWLTLNPAAGCGVKAAPTPILSAPPSPLQQEAVRRAAEAEAEKKEKQKKEKKNLEQR
jgi:hypothetical protein